jgi:ribosomal protein S12 methylthiotransferase accessory factor
MGITRVANVTGLDYIGIPVVMVCRPNSRALAVSQGKGLDLDAAKASGLMESVEAYHAERISLPLKLASYEEIRSRHRVVDVSGLRQRREGLFHPDQPLLWIEGRDLLQEQPVWLPYEVVHTNFTTTPVPGAKLFAATSNGLASGNHPLEAISHAMCEVVERDASALWLLLDEEGRQATRIDLGTVDDPAGRSVLELFERAGIVVAVWETTTDIGIPAFRCTIADRDERSLSRFPPASGMGCHPSRPIALLRALLEAAQSRLTAISGSRDDIDRSELRGAETPTSIQRQRAQLQPGEASRPFSGPSWEADTFDEDVAWELERLRAAGLEEVVVVDLTQPDYQVPVVRVVVPGLELLDRDGAYRPGRRAGRVIAQRL